jgi:hypothetical protein
MRVRTIDSGRHGVVIEQDASSFPWIVKLDNGNKWRASTLGLLPDDPDPPVEPAQKAQPLQNGEACSKCGAGPAEPCDRGVDHVGPEKPPPKAAFAVGQRVRVVGMNLRQGSVGNVLGFNSAQDGLWSVHFDGGSVGRYQANDLEPADPAPPAESTLPEIERWLTTAERQANDSERADSETYHRHFITLAVENTIRAVRLLSKGRQASPAESPTDLLTRSEVVALFRWVAQGSTGNTFALMADKLSKAGRP